MPTGYGAAQWGGTRLTNPNAGQDKMGLFDFADKFGFDPNSTEGQDRFSVYELTQNPEYAGAYKDLLSAGTNINKATQIFGDQYESPKNLGASLADRQAKAGLYQNYYSNPSSLSAADQAAIAKTKTGMFDPAFQKYAADKAAAEKATQLAKTQTQTVTDPMVDTTGFNTGVDTSVNDQIMQQSNDYLNQSLQNNLNNNFVDPNNFSTGMGTYNTGMSFSSGNSAQGRGINEFGESNGLVIPGPGNNDFWPFAKGGAVGHALRIAHHYATGGHTPAQPNYEREIDRINRMLAEKAEVNPATQDWSARRNEYLQGRPGPQIRDRSFARGGYADGGGAESVLMQDKLNAPNQWLQFGGQDMDRAPTGLPIGQAVGTDVAYHTLEGLGHGAELTKRASEGEMLSMRDPETFEKVNSAAGVAMTGGIGGAPKGAVLGSGPVRKSLDDIVGGWENKGVKLDVSGGGEKPLGISRIVVPEDMRSQGIGSQVMNDLVAHADDANKMMTLTPSKDFGASSVDRLRNFYKQFGFVENKGKNKDYSISDTMYRKPTAVEPQIGLKQHEPEGYLAHDNPSRKQNFENWFGESVVKNQDGTPKTVYHGSGADFSVFRPSKTGEFGPGVYATDLADEASSYAGTHLEGTGQNVMPVHIRMEQPFVAKNPSDFWDAFGGKTDTDAMLNAQKAGYDGVIIERPYTIYDDKRKQFYQTGQTHTHYVVFDPKQIKSAIGNKGTYDLKSPKITEARGGAIPFGPEAAQRAVQIAKQQAGRR
jgi:GNAT superfamily N-acetyltransferase